MVMGSSPLNPKDSAPPIDRGCDQSCWRSRCRAGVDLRKWPIAYLYTDGELTDALFEERIGAMDGLLARAEPFVCVMILDPSAARNPSHRKRIAEWNNQRSVELRRHCRGMAFVFPDHPIVRFIMGSMLAVMRRPVPYKVFGTEEQATVWARAQLAGRG
jgi:hypothetical protein